MWKGSISVAVLHLCLRLLILCLAGGGFKCCGGVLFHIVKHLGIIGIITFERCSTNHVLVDWN